MELEGARLASASAPTARRPRASARRRRRSRSSRSTARRSELQGIGKTIEGKIVEVVDDGEIHALTKRKAEVPAEVATFMRLPGLGPKTARRIWQELGITTVAALKAAAEAGAAARPRRDRRRRPEEKIAAALAQPQAGRRGRDRAAARDDAAAAARRRRDAARAPGCRSRSRSPARRGACARPCATSTSSPPRPTRRRSSTHFCSLPWVVEVAAQGPTKATVVSHDGLRFDLRVVPPESYGNLLQHFTGSKNHNVALREDAVRRGLLRLRVRRHRRRDRRGAPLRARGGRVPLPRLRVDPARAARGRRRARGCARRTRCRSSSSSRDLRGDLHTHTTWSDGKDSLEAMVEAATRARLRVLRDLRPLAAAARRPAAAAVGADRRAQRAGRAVPHPQGHRGEHPARRDARRLGRGRSRRATGSSHRCTRASTTTRPSGCSRRWRARTSTASAT